MESGERLIISPQLIETLDFLLFFFRDGVKAGILDGEECDHLIEYAKRLQTLNNKAKLDLIEIGADFEDDIYGALNPENNV